jgi:hypothetical protein
MSALGQKRTSRLHRIFRRLTVKHSTLLSVSVSCAGPQQILSFHRNNAKLIEPARPCALGEPVTMVW